MKKCLFLLVSFAVLSVGLLGCSSQVSRPAEALGTPPPEQRTESGSYRVVKINDLGGIVTLNRSGDSYSAYEGLLLKAEDVMVTDTGSFADCVTDTDKHIYEHENTSLSVSATETEENGAVVVSLNYGKADFDIENKLPQNSTFSVKTPEALAGVRGTKFSVFYNPVLKKSVFEVETGVVHVEREDGKECDLSADDKTTVVTSFPRRVYSSCDIPSEVFSAMQDAAIERAWANCGPESAGMDSTYYCETMYARNAGDSDPDYSTYSSVPKSVNLLGCIILDNKDEETPTCPNVVCFVMETVYDASYKALDEAERSFSNRKMYSVAYFRDMSLDEDGVLRIDGGAYKGHDLDVSSLSKSELQELCYYPLPPLFTTEDKIFFGGDFATVWEKLCESEFSSYDVSEKIMAEVFR